MTVSTSAGSPLRILSRHSGLLAFPVGIVARLPIAMLTLGISAYVVVIRGSVAEAGLAGGGYALGAAIGGPLAGSFADRFGQRRIGYVLLGANALAIVSVLLAADKALPLLFAAAVAAGLTVIPVGPFARVRWTRVIDTHVPAGERSRVRGAAFGYETLADELTFVFGPVIVGLLSYAAVTAPLLACIAIVAVFGYLFSRHAGASLTPSVAARPEPAAPASALLRGDRAALVATMTVIGTLLGCQITSVVAFAGERGALAQAGLIYAGFGIGSGLASVGIGLIRTGASLYRRWLAAAALAIVASTVAAFVTEKWLLAVTLTVLGLGVGPIIVTVYQLAGNHLLAGRESLHMGTLSSALIGGNAIGAALAGAMAEQRGSRWGFVLVAALAAVLVVFAAVSWWTSRRIAGADREGS